MASSCPGKTSWPELVGISGENAFYVIPIDNPNIVNVVIVASDHPDEGTRDINCRRVKVKVDHDGNIVEVPVVG